MKRAIFARLLDWKEHSARKPLILRGVRQCGKTYILKQFAEQEFPTYHYFNFEKQHALAGFFERNLDPKSIINELAIYTNTPIDVDKDLVIFDEIQACAKALTSLKYFCEDMPQLALCSAGSLLGLTLGEGSYPVGKVDMLHLYPMSFSEFLQGIGETQLADYIFTLTTTSSIANPIHEKLWEKLKLYFIIGGLPDVVSTFSSLQDNMLVALQTVRLKQEELINAYYADIAKHSGKISAMHIDRVWRAVPTQLFQTQDGGAPKFKFKDIIPGSNRYSRLVHVFDWLQSAELIIKVPIVKTIKKPLSAFTQENNFKCFMFDIGILGAISGLNPKNILEYDYGTYKGYFAENFVLQEILATSGKKLFNWQENRYEVEFLIDYDGNVIPIEVKSGFKTKTKSLHKYNERYNPNKRLILSARNLINNQTDNLLQLPLYTTGIIERFLI